MTDKKKFTRQDYELARSDVEKSARVVADVTRGKTGYGRWPQYIQSALIKLEMDLRYLDTVAGEEP